MRPNEVAEFCDTVEQGCIDAQVQSRYEFAIGFAACLDAVSRGTFGPGSDPLEVIAKAWSDVTHFPSINNQVTNVFRAVQR